MFQAGTCFVVAQKAEAIRFLRRINMEMIVSMHETVEPSVLGTYTLTSSGYQLHTQISLLNIGESWEGTERSWCLLSLSKVRLLQGTTEESVQL